jgi:mono/diheme cytochrome c family protein
MSRVGFTIFALLAAASPTRAADPTPEQVEFFEAKVRPLLVGRCQDCHGPEKQKGGLRLDSPGAMRAGGDSGPAIEPGDPENSPLVEAVTYEGAVQMPPDGKLDAKEIAALAAWVKMGAPWPAATEPAASVPAEAPRAITEADRDFWAFRPVQDPPAPAVEGASWPRTSIDPFILARLEAAGLAPAPPADRRAWLRRVTFDLTGLPPTPVEVEHFLDDDAADAPARVVDRLLASPRYGERWARHWLDLARYGEDQAHSFQPRLYPSGFRYRDWVVSAFNADMPYDRFLREQIAADLLDGPDRRENLPALGFFACGPVYYGDPKKFDQYDDRIDTLTRGVLGLTVACARCHDHKYDPITQADYYGLAGVFASTEYVEAPVAPPEEVAAYERATAGIKAKEGEIAALLDGEAKRLQLRRAGESARYLVASWKVRQRDAKGSEATVAAVAKDDDLEARQLGRWLAFLKEGSEPHPILARLNSTPEGSGSESLNAVEAASREVQATLLELLGRKPKGAEAKLVEALTGEKGPLGVSKRRLEEQLDDEAKGRLKAMRADLERSKADAPPMYAVAHALKEANATGMKILARGNPDSPGAEAPRRFLEVLGAAPLATGSGRRELARAVASPDNPLTARVFVNRLWQHHFGRGLVATPSNFGKLGEPPSHPELLDHLAARFIQSGWSVKHMHRLILLSAAYAQASTATPEALAADPENRLLSRMSRKRLEVEPWRDAVLAVSGRLDPAVGGASVPLDSPKNRRRTLYAAVSRHDLDPLLRLFDFPDPNITAAERTRTTVPLQGLVVLNDAFLIDSARALADRLAAESGDDAARIDRAYRLLFARPPTDREASLGVAYLQGGDGAPEAGGLSRWTRYAQALLGTNEFVFLD